MTAVFSQLTRKWNGWNDRLEQFNTGIVSHVANWLPSSAQRVIKKRLTQAQLIVHNLGTCILLQGTFGNLLLSPWVTYPIGISGIAATSGLYYRFLTRHFSELLETPLMSRITGLAFSTIFVASQCIVLYQMDKFSEFTGTEKMSLGIWSTFANVSLQTLFHSFLINTSSSSEEVHLNTDDHKIHPIRRETEENCERLQEEITELKTTIANIRQFIRERPQLNALCERYIAEHPEGIVSVKKPQLEGLDPNDIYDFELMLKLRKNAYADELEEIMLFIRRHSEVYLCFKEHLKNARAEIPGRDVLLLEPSLNLEE